MKIFALQWQDGYDPWGWETIQLYTLEFEADKALREAIKEREDKLDGLRVIMMNVNGSDESKDDLLHRNITQRGIIETLRNHIANDGGTKNYENLRAKLWIWYNLPTSENWNELVNATGTEPGTVDMPVLVNSAPEGPKDCMLDIVKSTVND